MRKSFTVLFMMFVFVVGLAGMSSSFAQRKKKANPCDNAKNQNEMNTCAENEYKTADVVLNRVYGQLMSKLEDDQKAKLKEAEQAWIKYRDSNCEFEAFPNFGGSIYPLVYNGCLKTMTNNRTKELKAFIEDFK